MSGKIWRFSCCQKKKERGQHLSKSKQKGKEIHGVSLQPSTSGIDIDHVNDFRESGGQNEQPERTTKEFLSSTPVEQKQNTGIKDRGDHVHAQNIRAGVTLNGFEEKDFVDKVGSSVVPSSEGERDYQLIKLQLDTAQTEKQKLEAQVLQANQNVRDLRHEIAVLQKRLQVAENRLPNLPPLCPPPPPPLPPPAQPHVNPLRALLTIIQKRRNSRDPNICPLQDVGPLPGSPEDTEASYNHQCPGMNDVLEMIRNGVSLRHVIQVHKESFRAGEDGAEPAGSQLVPELQKILRKRKVSADKHVSDGSCDGSMEEDPGSRGPSPQRDDPAPRSSPGEGSLQSPPQRENLTQDTGDADGEVDEGQSDGDAGSTVSTLPLTSPLDQGLVRSVNASPCPDGPATDTSSGQPHMEGPGSNDLTTNSENRVLPADHGVTVNASLQSDCSPNLPDQSPVLRYLNWDRWSGVDLKNALPFKSIFKSVSFMTNSNGGEKIALQNPQDPRSESPEALESDRGGQSFGSADSGEGVSEDAHGQFSLLHDMLKPPMAPSGACEEQAHTAIASEVARVLNPEFLEESVDGPELGSPLPENQPGLKGPAFVPPERGSVPHCF
ncbi:uncharacterized protein LOC118206200 [Anguilla anguilla]|uniref:uncharacterized protein LOC118206200 n=1 Tax=Anguilla anguilla TaxID=7936 RepID=UPI0015AE5192|nr:uncharacterized protein LOC118206200 [Anguilla anguilla]